MIHEILRVFGKRVREARLELGISQEELAFRAGLHRTYLGAVERGERNVSLVNIHKISVGLSVSLGDLFQEVKP